MNKKALAKMLALTSLVFLFGWLTGDLDGSNKHAYRHTEIITVPKD